MKEETKRKLNQTKYVTNVERIKLCVNTKWCGGKKEGNGNGMCLSYPPLVYRRACTDIPAFAGILNILFATLPINHTLHIPHILAFPKQMRNKCSPIITVNVC